ncbi:CAP domain-containing protein [Brevibacillus ginsengisoli]|uniref:CAP domain-containing protein n=1 Tax=Brevibacillus ginsengisoli TaxID=363854 RepID=UPI003CE7DE8B
MKKRFSRKPLMAIALGLALSSITTSAFAATYQVKPNDTLSNIAQNQGVPFYQLLWANPQICNPDLIFAGMTLNVPQQSNSQPVNNTVVSQPQTNQQPVQQPVQQTPEVGTYAQQVFTIVNQERAKAGLKPLQLDSTLSKVANDKAVDMSTNHYFDHNSPTYGSPFDMMKQYGISSSYAGENIAMGQQSAQQVMNDWMNSQGHRENILNPNFDTIGIGYYNGYWVQEFTGKVN